jgi:hypothetical protein
MVPLLAPARRDGSDRREGREQRRTLNPYVDIVLRLFGLAGIFVGFGEGVCDGVGSASVQYQIITPPQ